MPIPPEDEMVQMYCFCTHARECGSRNKWWLARRGHLKQGIKIGLKSVSIEMAGDLDKAEDRIEVLQKVVTGKRVVVGPWIRWGYHLCT
jgi:hypothetical protein